MYQDCSAKHETSKYDNMRYLTQKNVVLEDNRIDHYGDFLLSI